MITFRRRFLDERLSRWSGKIASPTLDLGGKKEGKRGSFRPPRHLLEGWVYANIDPAGRPDCRCAAETLPFKAGRFGSVIMTEVLEYLDEPSKAFAEIRRVLRDGGIALLSVPLLVPVHFDREFDKSRWTAAGLRKLASEGGLEVSSLEPMGSLFSVMHDLLTISCGYAAPDRERLGNRLARRLLGAVHGLVALLDGRFVAQSEYITTGYFLVLRKPGESVHAHTGN